MGKTKNAWWKHRLIATLLVVMTVFATCITPALAAYDKNVDYGQKMAQLAQAGKANSPEYKAAQAARNEKIKDMYGGKEPPLNGSTNGTRLSDVLNSSNYGGMKKTPGCDLSSLQPGKSYTFLIETNWEIVMGKDYGLSRLAVVNRTNGVEERWA